MRIGGRDTAGRCLRESRSFQEIHLEPPRWMARRPHSGRRIDRQREVVAVRFDSKAVGRPSASPLDRPGPSCGGDPRQGPIKRS